MTHTKIAKRMENIVPFYVMDILAKAKEMEAQGKSIIHMEVGEPDFVSPQPIIDAGKKALDDGHTGYTAATGIPELRLKISENYQKNFNLKINPKRIIITPGASGALQLIFGVLVNPGQTVLMTDPGYPCNKNFVEFMSGIPTTLAVGPESGYQLSASQVEKAWNDTTCSVLIASPSNPTGTMIPRVELAAIHEVATANGGSLIVDEIYQGLVYGEDSYTALEFADNLFVINSFSKYYGMTGWRLGWLVAPEPYVESLDRLAQNLFLSCSAPAQYAALEAFTPECQQIMESRKQQFHKRRDFLIPALRELGFKIPVVPDGAFYLYADCSELTNDSFTFAYELLEKEGVAVTPGKDFGNNKPEQHIRFAYTNSIESMQEGVERIRRFIERK